MNTSPSNSGTPSVLRLTVAGPSVIAIGQGASFAAAAQLTDGSTEDYTSKVVWSTQGSDILSVDSGGRVEGHASGEAAVVARFGFLSASIAVIAVPPGTFRMNGTVTDDGVPVTGAVVTVTSGVGAGLSGTTDAAGTYRIYGVVGDVQVQAVKDGYLVDTTQVSVSGNTTTDFSLSLVNPRPDVAGVYAMTVTADPACPAPGADPLALSDAARQRRYVATVTQSQLTFKVVLSGATFVVQGGAGNGFTGQIGTSGLTFTIGDGVETSAYPDLIESLDDKTVLIIAGSGSMTQSGADLIGSLNGVMITGSPAIWTNLWYTGSCWAGHHQLVLTRQPSMSNAKAAARR